MYEYVKIMCPEMNINNVRRRNPWRMSNFSIKPESFVNLPAQINHPDRPGRGQKDPLALSPINPLGKRLPFDAAGRMQLKKTLSHPPIPWMPCLQEAPVEELAISVSYLHLIFM